MPTRRTQQPAPQVKPLSFLDDLLAPPPALEPSRLDTRMGELAQAAFRGLLAEKRDWIGSDGTLPGWEAALVREAASYLSCAEGIDEDTARVDVAVAVHAQAHPIIALEWMVTMQRAAALAAADPRALQLAGAA